MFAEYILELPNKLARIGVRELQKRIMKGIRLFVTVSFAVTVGCMLCGVLDSGKTVGKYNAKLVAEECLLESCHDIQPGNKQLLERKLKISDHCLSKAKEFLNHQRGGWGSMTRKDLYRGAQDAFNTSIGPFLPSTVPERVLDIGCGMALYDTFVFERYDWDPKVSIYLFDKSTDEVHSAEFRGQGFNPDGQFSFYTSLECARQTLVDNGALAKQVHAVSVSETALDAFDSNSFDFVFSLLSWGHHYPIHTYLTSVKRIMKNNAKLLVDLRYKRKGLLSTFSERHPKTMAVVVQACEGGAFLQKSGFICKPVRIRSRGITVLCDKGL